MGFVVPNKAHPDCVYHNMAESYIGGSLGEMEEKGLGSSLSSLLARLDQGLYRHKEIHVH